MQFGVSSTDVPPSHRICATVLKLHKLSVLKPRKWLRSKFQPPPTLLLILMHVLFSVNMHAHPIINPLTPNDSYKDRTAPLTSKVAFYIFIQQI